MNKEEIFGAFSLVNNPIVLSEEEIKDIQKAIKELQQENKQLKNNWNKLKDCLKDKYTEYDKEKLDFFYGYKVCILGIRDKMQELEKSDGNE